jgi:hypothetical protein
MDIYIYIYIYMTLNLKFKTDIPLKVIILSVILELPSRRADSIMASFPLICHIHFYRNRTRFRIHRPSVEKSPVLIVASVKYNRGSEKNIENCFFHINFRPGA